MSIEAASVVLADGTAVLHAPPGRTHSWIPDTRSLWDFAWENRSRIDGIAHTHPGTGYPGPSGTDLTTFEAMEKGLGRRLRWWILSASHSVLLEWDHRNPGYDITRFLFPSEEPAWMLDLRRVSYPEMDWPSP